MIRFAILSWALYLFLASTGAGRDAFAWLKMGELFDHYEEHLAHEEDEGNADFSVFDFLSMHYGADEHHESEGESHKGLPFFNQVSFAFVALLPSNGEVPNSFAISSVKGACVYTMHEPSAPRNALFRPPLA